MSPSRCVAPCDFAPSLLVSIAADGSRAARGPFQLVPDAQAALERWLGTARSAGLRVEVASAYRSYADQVAVYMQTTEVGRAARPGHSEHQLGTAVDLRYETEAAGAWLAGHAADYGFALSYPPGKERITGYRAEPWHFRFVGNEVARWARGRSLHEVFVAHPELVAPTAACDRCPSRISTSQCQGVGERGRCDGTILSWCFEGTLARVDCGSERVCSETADGSSCVAF